MKFRFIVSKTANQFFFISNLAEWHFSCRKEYNKTWLEQTGALTPDERSTLKAFRRVMEKRGFGFRKGNSLYLGTIFYSDKRSDVWQKTRRALSKEEYRIMQKTWHIFSPRFEKFWEDLGLKERIQRVKVVKDAINTHKNKRLINALEHFVYLIESEFREIDVIVLFPPLGTGGTAAGGANIGNNNKVSLELPELKKNILELDISVGILLHEALHLIFNSRGIRQWITQIIKDLKLQSRLSFSFSLSPVEFMDELIVGSLVPYGYFTRRFYGKKFSEQIFSKINLSRMREAYHEFQKEKRITNSHRLIKYFAWSLYSQIDKYVKSEKVFGKEFAQKIIETLE